MQFLRKIHNLQDICPPARHLSVTLANMKECVLVVDDDPHLREVVCYALEQEGYTAVIARDGAEALRQQQVHKPDLVILDVLMPELDGIAVCQEIRRASTVPIIILSSRDEEVDKIIGLDAGADDYVAKPFSPRELVARVRANLRRQVETDISVVEHEDYRIDNDAYTAFWLNEALPLTQTEFQLLRTLVSAPDKVFSREELMQRAYNVKKVVSYRTIDSHMRRLREKLAAAGTPGIKTVHGVGFRLATPLSQDRLQDSSERAS